MLFIVAATVVLGYFAGSVQCGSLMQTVSVNVNQSCPEYQTQCAFGCCPYSQGVCCIDGFECCEHGQTCIPIVGICIGAVNNNGEISLSSKKSTHLISSVFKCPSGTTECGPDRCCIYDQGVCCEDGDHCCPKDYRCDLSAKKCLRGSTNDVYGVVPLEKSLRKLSYKSSHKSCLGGNSMCPNYMSCCVQDNGSWGCCPNPSVPEIRYGGGQCCDTIFGHMCCPDDYPICTIIGCTK